MTGTVRFPRCAPTTHERTSSFGLLRDQPGAIRSVPLRETRATSWASRRKNSVASTLTVPVPADSCTSSKPHSTLGAKESLTLARSTAEADRLGIRAFFDSYKSKTGTVGVIDANGKTVSVLKGEMDPSKYVAAVKKANGQDAS